MRSLHSALRVGFTASISLVLLLLVLAAESDEEWRFVLTAERTVDAPMSGSVNEAAMSGFCS